MSHKRKAVPLPFLEIQQKKTQHYQKFENEYIKILLSERTKENSLQDQKRKLEVQIQSIDECLKWCRENPELYVYRGQINGYDLPFQGKKAEERLYNDKKEVMKVLETVKTQLKLCIENQKTIENQIRSSPTFEQRIQRYDNTGRWIW